MKRFPLWFVSIPLLALATGCGWFGSSPGKSVSKFLSALAKEKYDSAYALVSSRDRAVKNLDVFSAESAANNPARSAAGDAAYEIGEVKIEGDKATVQVSTTPAGGAAASHTYSLVKEPEGWRLSLGWEAQALLLEAKRLRDEDKLAESLEKFEKVLELEPGNTDAHEGALAVDKMIRTRKLEQEYMEANLEIIGFKVTPGRGRGRSGTTVSGRLLNNGHHTLSEVELTVYFLSEDNQIVAEKTYRPVPSADIVYYGEGGMLKRGLTRDFGYVVDEALPQEWAGKARPRITRIKFEEST